MKKYQFATIILVLLILTLSVFLYFTSVKFIKVPEIKLPTNQETLNKIEYENEQILKDIEINEQNFKDTIKNLTRAKSYSCIVTNTIYAYGTFKPIKTEVFVKNNKTLTIRDNIRVVALDDTLTISQNNNTKTFNKSDFSNDEIIGIKTFEDLININADFSIQTVYINDEKCIEAVFNNGEYTEHYYISLVSGLLIEHIVKQDDITIKHMQLSNLEVKTIDDSIFE